MLLGDEMFSDTYKIKLVDDVLYEVYGKVYIYTYKVFFFVSTEDSYTKYMY